ncbi:DUF368 domain-containing protein [Kistimonas asteriae]|uniref:DUF368 domain-containing protein n=1 Tax=Kistimonas asteriae TaxID=517724 RepID=UPI001BAB687B|nr:DUF368 domain-containing protein [Kistimonas asteriae]
MLPLEVLILFLKGALMGAADVVPGVSGGTIAFITGIYERLLNSLKKLGPASLKILFREGVAACWRHIDGTFLVAVFGGVLFSVFTMARVITYSLSAWPIQVWSFFFGLVVISAVLILRKVSHWSLARIAALVAGVGVAVFIGHATPGMNAQPEWYSFLWAGALAICAMILPGISGSFILLLLGFYAPVLQAVTRFDLGILFVFASGCVVGLLLFSHVLSWLLSYHRQTTLAFLVGLMLGAIEKIWPWKQTLAWKLADDGAQIPVQQVNVMPWHYESLTGQSPEFLMALALMMIAIIAVSVFERCSRSKIQTN